ncbi:hypothetical protein CKA32_005269 [Geitlerinema sp. FC II]|nr:hypothetical protein CKA32_005269 [Geitlerinema sp. FC II]
MNALSSWDRYVTVLLDYRISRINWAGYIRKNSEIQNHHSCKSYFFAYLFGKFILNNKVD